MIYPIKDTILALIGYNDYTPYHELLDMINGIYGHVPRAMFNELVQQWIDCGRIIYVEYKGYKKI